jgi:hypothetical protein
MTKEDYGVMARPIAVRIPQANAIVEQVHQHCIQDVTENCQILLKIDIFW